LKPIANGKKWTSIQATVEALEILLAKNLKDPPVFSFVYAAIVDFTHCGYLSLPPQQQH
jgi:hypothetical protein